MSFSLFYAPLPTDETPLQANMFVRSSTSGYRIEKRLVQFDSKPSEFQCKKCEEVFDTVEEVDDHEDTRQITIP
jgi:hypothetical protein